MHHFVSVRKHVQNSGRRFCCTTCKVTLCVCRYSSETVLCQARAAHRVIHTLLHSTTCECRQCCVYSCVCCSEMFNRMNNNAIRHQNVVKYRDVLPLACFDCHFTPTTSDFTVLSTMSWEGLPPRVQLAERQGRHLARKNLLILCQTFLKKPAHM